MILYPVYIDKENDYFSDFIYRRVLMPVTLCACAEVSSVTAIQLDMYIISVLVLVFTFVVNS